MARILLAFALLATSGAWAQQIRVEKVKGNKAIVEFTGTPPTVGKTYSLSSGNGRSAGGGSRDNSIGLDFTFSSLTSSPASTLGTTAFGGSIRYGWNSQSYELGPIFSYTSENGTGVDKSTFALGMFFDYNLVANLPGTDFVYGVGAIGSYGSNKSGSASTSVMTVAPLGFLKWFPFGNALAVRTDLKYVYSKYSATGADYTVSGIALVGGLSAYY